MFTRTAICLFALTLGVAANALGQSYSFSTIAGQPNQSGSADGPAASATFYDPTAAALDHAGNVYVTDAVTNEIRKISSDGTVSTLAGGTAGSADGQGRSAQFYHPTGLVADSQDNLYVTDLYNGKIRKVTPSGVVTTFAGGGPGLSHDGVGTTAAFYQPTGITIDSRDNLYVTDQYAVRKIAPNGTVTTLAGSFTQFGSADGPSGSARFSYLDGIAVDSGYNLYVADAGNRLIRKIDATGAVSTFAGQLDSFSPHDGVGTAATFTGPRGIALARNGLLYVTDGNLIRSIGPDASVSTLSGGNFANVDGIGQAASFFEPGYLAVDAAATLYIPDSATETIRKGSLLLNAALPSSSTLATGSSLTLSATISGTAAVSGYQWLDYGSPIAGATSSTYTITGAQFSDAGSYQVVLTSSTAGKVTSNAEGVTVVGPPTFTLQPSSVTVTATYPAAFQATVVGVPSATLQWLLNGEPIPGAAGATYSVKSAQGSGVYALQATNSYGSVTSASAYLTVLPAHNYVFSTFAGQSGVFGNVDASGSAARFDSPTSLARDSAGNLYTFDYDNFTIRKITLDGKVSTLAGTPGQSGWTDGAGSAARFGAATANVAGDGLAVTPDGTLYLADTANSTIRKITPDGTVSTLAGQHGTIGIADGVGTNALFNHPVGIAADRSGVLYVADTANNTIRKVLADGTVSTLAGLAAPIIIFTGGGAIVSTPTGNNIRPGGSADGIGPAASFRAPSGIVVDSTGVMYVTDTYNNTIRRISPDGLVTTLAGSAGTGGTGTVNSAGFIDGPTALARFNAPNCIAIDAAGNLYVGDGGNSMIREIFANGQVGTIGGMLNVINSYGIVSPVTSTLPMTDQDGLGSAANVPGVDGLVADPSGVLYLAEGGPGTIRRAWLSPIASQPRNASGASGQTITFSVGTAGLATYQWTLNGAPIPGASHPTLVLNSITGSDTGTYQCVAITGYGTVTSDPATLNLVSTSDLARLINLSVNAPAGGIQTLALGFVTATADTAGQENVLLRAAGPALSAFGVTAAQSDPAFTVYTNSVAVGSNDNWGSSAVNSASVLAANGLTGAFPFADATSLDSALTMSLPNGPHTMEVTGNGAAGTVVAEIYSYAAGSVTPPRLANLSCKQGISGGGSLTAGFVIGGSTAKTVLIRAIGPALASFGVSSALPDPQIVLYSSASNGDSALASNATWSGDPQLAAVSATVGAFVLADPKSADSVILTTLTPGAYSAVASSVSGAAGVVLIEVYDVP